VGRFLGRIGLIINADCETDNEVCRGNVQTIGGFWASPDFDKLAYHTPVAMNKRTLNSKSPKKLKKSATMVA
jgi:hypothetical protein